MEESLSEVDSEGQVALPARGRELQVRGGSRAGYMGGKAQGVISEEPRCHREERWGVSLERQTVGALQASAGEEKAFLHPLRVSASV